MQQKNDDKKEKDEMKRAKEAVEAYVGATSMCHGVSVPIELPTVGEVKLVEKFEEWNCDLND